MAKVLRYVRLVALSLLGLVLVRGGEVDDSPGLGGIGLILIAIALFLHWRSRRGQSHT